MRASSDDGVIACVAGDMDPMDLAWQAASNDETHSKVDRSTSRAVTKPLPGSRRT